MRDWGNNETRISKVYRDICRFNVAATIAPVEVIEATEMAGDPVKFAASPATNEVGGVKELVTVKLDTVMFDVAVMFELIDTAFELVPIHTV